MGKEIKKRLINNWFFLILLVGIIFIFAKRNMYLPMPVVSIPDAQIRFSTEDGVLEQSWMPTIKKIAGIQVPYSSENDFSCDVQLKIFSDDYSKTIVEATEQNVTFKAGQESDINFSFRKTSVIQGERYHIQISFMNPAEQGSLLIPSGSNYGGCSIAGKEVGQAAAITVTFLKYSKLFWLTAVLFPLLTFSLLAMVITGRKWEETVALSLFTEGIFLYAFGWFENLVLGIGVVYIFAFLSLVFAIYIFNRKTLCLQDLFSPGLLVYLIFLGIILVTCNGDWIAIRDELRHWQIAVRDMYYYDSFAKHINTTVILSRYLPFTALIQYVFVYMNGMFSEDILFVAYQVMLLSAFVILCKPLNKKGGLKIFVPTIIAMVCIPVIFFNNISSCIMVDSLLAAIFTYILVCYFTDEWNAFNAIRIASALVALVLVKDIGLIYAGMTALIIFGDMVLAQIRNKRFNVKELLYPVAGAVLAVAVFLSWQIYLSIPIKAPALVAESTEDVTTEESNTDVDEPVVNAISTSGFTVEGILNIFTGEGEAYQYQVTHNFVTELFDGATYSLANISFSFMDLLAIVAFLIILLTYFGYWQEDKARKYSMAILLLGASICLCAFLLLTYWFTFSMYEALELTSIDRYLAPYICAVMVLAFYMIYDACNDKASAIGKEKCLVIILAFFMVISMPVTEVIRESKDKEKNATEDIIYGHSDIAEILRSVAKRGERVYFICSNSGGLSEYVFRNTICPIVSEHDNWNIVATQEAVEQACAKYGGDGIGVKLLAVDDWKYQLSKCKYVVVFHTDNLFKESYAEVFGDTPIEDGSVYQVLNEAGEIKLQLMGKTGIKGYY